MVQKLGLDVGGEEPPDNNLGNDLVWGVAAIATAIGRSERQTYHLLETGNLPARKLGGRYVSSRIGLRKHFAAVISGEIL